MVICLEKGADLHMAQLMPLPLLCSLTLASVKSRLVLPFWYRLTCVVPEKGPLNGCVCVCVYILITSHIKVMSRIQRPLRSASILSMMVMMMCQAALVSLVTNMHFSLMHIYIRCVEYTRLADCPLHVQSATTMLLLYENNPV